MDYLFIFTHYAIRGGTSAVGLNCGFDCAHLYYVASWVIWSVGAAL